MTEAQSDRTRLKVWKDFLVAQGGTPQRGDTLYRTMQRIAVALGISDTTQGLLQLAKAILSASGGTPARGDTLYSTTRKLMIATGTETACCQMPPVQALGTPGGSGGSFPTAFTFGNPDEDWSFGDPDEDFAFGQPGG